MIDFDKEMRRFYIHDELKIKEYLDLVSHNYSGCDYSEIHHILPKSMYPEYKSTKENLVRMLYKDHIKAHKLLHEIYKTHGMLVAFHRMSGKNPENLMRGESNPSKRDDVRKKISTAKIGVRRKDMEGKKFFGASKETVDVISRKASDVHSGMVCVDDGFGNLFKVSIKDPRYTSGELKPFNSGKERPNSASKRKDVMDKIMSKREKTYEKFRLFTFDQMVDFLIDAHNSGKTIFAKKAPFSKNYSGYVKRTNFDQNELKRIVVQRLEKDSVN